jgi:hypothetical protein
MKYFVAILLGFVMTSCYGESHNPVARIDIKASEKAQAEVIAAIRRFGEHNDFRVFATDEMPKEGRLVVQIDLQRSDGIMITTDNFIDAGVLKVYFYAKKPEADWRSVKEALLHAITEAVQGHGEIIEVPVGPA